MMLILTRRVKENILIGDEGEICICVLEINGNQAKIGIAAPKEIPVAREEVYDKFQKKRVNIKPILIQDYVDTLAANDGWFLCKEK